MTTYNSGSQLLQMPSNYVSLSDDEMIYVEGGYTFLNDEWFGWHKTDRKTFAHGMNVVATIASVIVGLTAASAIKEAIVKFGKAAFGQKILTVGQKIGVGVGAANDILQSMADGNLSIGNFVALLADRFDRGGLDGYVEWHGWGK